MKLRNKNLKILKNNHVYSEEMEHDACGVGLVASTEGLKSRKVVEYGIDALKAVWHRGAIDAYSTTFLDFRPSVDATKPTPHASCSISSE